MSAAAILHAERLRTRRWSLRPCALCSAQARAPSPLRMRRARDVGLWGARRSGAFSGAIATL